MLFLIVTLMLILSLALLILRPERRSRFIFATCLSLAVFYFGILVYIAKKGGISGQMKVILFGLEGIRSWMQHLVMTLGQLGYIIAVGRYLFPLFLVLTALDMSYFERAEYAKRKVWLLAALPAASLIIYIPKVFKAVTQYGETSVRILVVFSKIWISFYLIMSLAIVIWEYSQITLSYFKRRFILKSMLIISLGLLYGFYATQDPAQIYMFYRSDYMWMLGLWYLSPVLSSTTYFVVLLGSVLSGVIGMYSLFRYVRIKYDEEREEVTLRRKANDASAGISMFIHGTKNELLASQILIGRLTKKYGTTDTDVVKLREVNENLLKRMELLNREARNGSVTMSAHTVDEVIGTTMESVTRRYPGKAVDIVNEIPGSNVLIDITQFPDSLSNLIMNAIEATESTGSDEAVEFRIRKERLWISFSVSDRGPGLSNKDRRKIWEPFYSSKNSSQNWGMGMYYARNVVKNHLGSIRYEKRKGGGTRFIVLLPRADRRSVPND